MRASVFYPSGGLMRTGLWTADRTRPAEHLARERPRTTEPMTPEKLEEMARQGGRQLSWQSLDELADLVVTGITEDRFVMMIDLDNAVATLRRRASTTWPAGACPHRPVPTEPVPAHWATTTGRTGPPMTLSDQRPSPHPALTGRETSMGALADTVRRLIDLTVSCDVPDDVLVSVQAELATAADRLEPFRSDPPHPRFVGIRPGNADTGENGDGGDGSDGGDGGDGGLNGMEAAMPYDVVVGRFNPLALPLTLSFEPDLALGHARFTAPYEGAPGWVHGAVIAAAFDLVLTGANRLQSSGGPTVRLSMRFRRPTLIEEECRFEAWVEGKKGNRIMSKGHLLQNGEVKVEAEGEFVMLDPSLLGRPDGAAGSPGGDA